MVRLSVSVLQHMVHASSSLTRLVVIVTPAPSVALQSMGQPLVTSSENDPRKVVTPIDVQKLTEVLDQFNILDKWIHVIHGLRHGFDIGKEGSVEKTFIPLNHRSVNIDPQFVDEYIAGELEAAPSSYPETSLGPECAVTSKTTVPVAIPVAEPKLLATSPLVFYNPCPFPRVHGKASR
jgi:hypothetical protein